MTYPDGYSLYVEEGYEEGDIDVGLSHDDCRWGIRQSPRSAGIIALNELDEWIRAAIADHESRHHS